LPSWLLGVRFNVFVSTSYSYNFNRPDSRTNQFRVFDFDDNTMKVDVFEFVAQHTVSKPRDAGFRADVTLGSSIPRVTSSSGLFRDATTTEDIDLQQAFVSYVAPVRSGIRFDAGKFVSHLGYEVIDGYDGWNDNATRSLLCGYAVPFTHLGLHASYAFSPRVSGMLMLVNGWDVARDNNRAKSVGAQVVLTPATPFTITLNGMYGPERTGNDSDARTILELIAIWKATSRLTLAVNGDWGSETGAVVAGEDARWDGVAGYARIAASGSLAVILRGEYFEDQDGARTGVAQSLWEFTFTPEARLTDRLILRSDVRVDGSDQAVFEKRNEHTDTQSTVLVSALYAF
jgi:hypothetical protein